MLKVIEFTIETAEIFWIRSLFAPDIKSLAQDNFSFRSMENDRINYSLGEQPRFDTVTTIEMTRESSVSDEKIPSMSLGTNSMNSDVLQVNSVSEGRILLLHGEHVSRYNP